MSWEAQAMAVIGGALSGALYSAAGYAKSRTKKEPFDRVRFFVALIWGLLVGGIAAARGWDYYQTADWILLALTWTQSLGLNFSFDYFAKIIVRHIDEKVPDEKESKVWDLILRIFGSLPTPPPFPSPPAPPPPSGDGPGSEGGRGG